MRCWMRSAELLRYNGDCRRAQAMNPANAKGESLLTFNDSLDRQAGAEASTLLTKRLVFHLGGYDPITPYVVAQRRFVRELARFERTWSIKASMGALNESPHQRNAREIERA